MRNERDVSIAGLAAAASLMLAAALGGSAVLLRSLDFLPAPAFLPAYVPSPPPEPSGPGSIAEPRTAGVTLVLVDGMSLETSRALPGYGELRSRGADVATRALFPSFTLPMKTTILTGAAPADHGLLANTSARPPAVPSVADVAARAGLRTASISVRDRIEEADLEPPASPYFRFVYVREPDATGHRHGSASPEYREAAQAADRVVAALASRIDLERETIVVATDHGHLATGGHGGHEEIVLAIPLVLAGAGIRPGSSIDASSGSDLRDVAPTVTALLGLPVPSGSSGRPLAEVLAFDPGPLPERRPPASDGGARPIAGIAAAAIAFAGLLWRRRPRPRGLVLGAAALAAFPALYALRGHPFSFSCVHSVAGIPWFALEVAMLAALPVALAALVAGEDRPSVLSIALSGSAGVALALLAYAGFRAPAALAHPRTSFGAVMALAGLAGVSLATLASCAVALGDRRLHGASRSPQG